MRKSAEMNQELEKSRQRHVISLWQQVLWCFLYAGNDPDRPEVFLTKELPDLSMEEIEWRCGLPSPGSLRASLFQLKKEGAVRPMSSLQGLRYRLTQEGKERVIADFPFARSIARKWDKTWRFVLFKEEHGLALAERSAAYKQLRRELTKTGFGALGKGLFLSAYPVSSELLQRMRTPPWNGLATAFETKGPLIGDGEHWLRQAYNLDILDKQYAKLGTKTAQMLHTHARKKTLTAQEKKSIATIFAEHLALIEQTPSVPEELTTRWPNIKEQHALMMQAFLKARQRERKTLE